MRTWLWKVWSSQPSVCCLGNMESPLLFVLCRTSAEVLYELVYLWPSGLNRFWNDFVPQMFTLDSEPECKLMSVVGDVSVPSHEFPFHLFFYCCFSICFPFYFFPMYFLFFSLLFAENRNSSCSPTLAVCDSKDRVSLSYPFLVPCLDCLLSSWAARGM